LSVVQKVNRETRAGDRQLRWDLDGAPNAAAVPGTMIMLGFIGVFWMKTGALLQGAGDRSLFDVLSTTLSIFRIEMAGVAQQKAPRSLGKRIGRSRPGRAFGGQCSANCTAALYPMWAFGKLGNIL